MDKYQVIGLLGEGSFGRVYKAKQLATGSFVALKIICKRGRCPKELKGLRRECEIQRHLHHPNIIQMLDSFETDNEIYVITEFAHKELNTLLGKKGVLPEETVQIIVWDLVSALYYLHSHRVLHRDLKPQNILLDTKNRAKLCDFGFARNMSTGTHVLTSIKGTPLYMAPELIEEQPYDHNADLWSLGCIIYELLEGAPPFRTTSILHLIKLIRHEQIQWPTMVSDHCISFLQGLLQKNPSKRMTWPEILNHPFVKGHIIISDDSPEMSLTRPMSANTLEVKEQQKRHHTNHRVSKFSTRTYSPPKSDEVTFKNKTTSPTSKTDQDLENNNPPIEGEDLEETCTKNVDTEGSAMSVELQKSVENYFKDKTEFRKNNTFDCSDSKPKSEGGKIDFVETQCPLVNEEWLVFLKKTIRELKSGEISSFIEPTMMDIIMSPLLNPSSNSAVVGLVAKLYCLPFSAGITDPGILSSLKILYLDINLVPNFLYSVRLLFYRKSSNTPVLVVNTPPPEEGNFRNLTDLSVHDFNCLEHVFLAINHFVHWNKEYVEQFCEAIDSLEIHGILKLLLLCTKIKLRIVLDLLSCLTNLLRVFPDRHEIVDKILLADVQDPEMKPFNFVELLRHVNPMLRERTCYFMLLLGNTSPKTLASLWNEVVKETLEALMFDSIDTVRLAAERTCVGLKEAEFYTNG